MFKLFLTILGICFILPTVAATQQAGITTLIADHNDGFDSVWQRRPYYGKSTWGIRGSNQLEEGWMWFDHFPGVSGFYCVTAGVVLENDGSSKFSLRIGNQATIESYLPFAHGAKKDCNRRGKPARVGLGRVFIDHMDRVSVFGRSDYACGLQKGGAYALWYELKFTPSALENECVVGHQH
ncbi:MAG: hypothetical protein ACI8P9_000615 [Parasphingorhabdus sp.]